MSRSLRAQHYQNERGVSKRRGVGCMAYMYILECGDGSYYTGSTINLEKRLKEHQGGAGANYTIKKQPVELVYFEEYNRIDDAFYREKQVQGWTHAKKKALIDNNKPLLPVLAKKVFSRSLSEPSN